MNSGSWWWTGRPGALWFMGLQRVGQDWVTELTDWLRYFLISFFSSSLTQDFLISTLFSLHVFVFIFISVIDFSFHTLMVRIDIMSILLNLLKFYSLENELSWRTYHVHLKRMCILMLLDEMSCRYPLRLTTIMCIRSTFSQISPYLLHHS